MAISNWIFVTCFVGYFLCLIISFHFYMLYSYMVMQWRERGRVEEGQFAKPRCHTTCLLEGRVKEIVRNNYIINNWSEIYLQNWIMDSFPLYYFSGLTKMLTCWMSVLWCWVLVKFMGDLFWAILCCGCLLPKGYILSVISAWLLNQASKLHGDCNNENCPL